MRRSTIAVTLLGLLVASSVAWADSSPLACSNSPFGITGRLIQNVQFMDLVGTSGATNVIDEYRPARETEAPPITRVYRNPLTTGNGTFQKAVNADLNGDGRDEIVAAFLNGATLTLAVYERASGLTPAAALINSWSYTGATTLGNFDIIAGDFDGSQDGQQELAITWLENGKQHLGVLLGTSAGNGDGVIANPGNTFAGQWTNIPSVTNPHISKLARGDFLLDGRDQIVVASNMQTDTELDIDLLEYNSPNPAALPVASGDSNIGSQHFWDAGSTFQGGAGEGHLVFSIANLSADGGDIVDSAAAELVVHEQFETSDFGGARYVIGQRLYHFARSPDAPGAITSVSLAAGQGPNVDATQVVHFGGTSQFGTPVPDAFATTIADIDGDGKAEILLALGDQSSSNFNRPLSVAGYKAKVVPRAGFTYALNGYTVTFTSNTSKAASTYDWNFGDGTPHSTQANPPAHTYSSNQSYTITLTASDANGASNVYQAIVSPGNGAASSGGVDATYNYRLVYAQASVIDYTALPAYGANFSTSYAGFDHVQIASGAMNHDGLHRVMVMARDVGSSQLVRALGWFDGTGNFAPVPNLQSESNGDFAALGNISVLASDFDGESMHATLGTDCRQNVVDRQMRSLIWMPPYYAALQDEALADIGISARFAKTKDTTTSLESEQGTYSSHSVSGYVGEEAGFELGPLEAEDGVKFTFGGDFESARGSIHASDQGYSYTEGSTASGGEALVQDESTTSDCYSYDAVRYGGKIPNSSLHFCEIQRDANGQPRDHVTDTNAGTWNSLNDQTGAPYAPTPHWFPLYRDWASLALFHPATLNGTPVNDATDGLFTTPVTSVAKVQPYLDIDLGAVRDIAAIRVFPAANVDPANNNALTIPLGFAKAAKDLVGFRVYASIGKFASAAVPVGAGVTSFAPDTADGAVSDRWNIWTRNPQDNQQSLRARYIRLQNPSTAPTRINISEIQVFGDTHVDPPAYPDAVCDAVVSHDALGNPIHDDGYFYAEVWNPLSAPPAFQRIEVRGDLMWSGANVVDAQGNATSTTGVPGCSNDTVQVRDGAAIWGRFLESSSSTNANSWDVGQTNSTTLGSTRSFDTSFHVGAEYDFKAGFGVKVTAGVAYEYTHGVTSDFSSSTTWGNELSVGGDIAGFNVDSIGTICGYQPRPYAFHLNERSNVGFQHDVYAADYIVREGGGPWQRANLPSTCKEDRIFYDNIEQYH